MKRIANLHYLDEKFESSKKDKYNPLFDLFKNEFDKAFKSEEEDIDYILDNFYVDSRDGRDFTNLNVMTYINKKFDIENLADLEGNISKIKGKLFLLVGKKGIGKTTLLNAYLRNLNRNIIPSSKFIPIYLDLKNMKDNEKFKAYLEDNIYVEINIYISENLPDIAKYLHDFPLMQELDKNFESMPKGDLCKWFLDNEVKVTDKLLRYLRKRGYTILIIIDNIDDFSVHDIKAIIDLAQYMRHHYGAKCLVAIRDHWNPRDLRVSDRTIAALNLYRPVIREIIFQRLAAVKELIKPETANFKAIQLTYGEPDTKIILTCEEIIDTFKIICEEFTDNSNQLYEDIYKLSNYDVRDFLENIYHFFHSPYLYSRPIFNKSIIQKFKSVDEEFSVGIIRKSKFFDYLGGFMTPHTLYYDVIASNIFNIFYHEDFSGNESDYKNTLVYIRILENVPDQTRISIQKEILIKNIEDIGYEKSFIESALAKLLEEGLLESPDGLNLSAITIVNLSSKGEIYLKNLIYQFTFLLFICDAVPMEPLFQINVREKFGTDVIPLKKGGSLNLKIRSVESFIKFLENEEDMEYNHCKKNNRWRLENNGELNKKIKAKIDPQIDRLRNAETKRSIKEIKDVIPITLKKP